MAEAAEHLSIFPDPKKKGRKAPPTKDHLAPEDGSAAPQPPSSQSVNGSDDLKPGGFEKLSAMFGSRGPMFALPSDNGTAK